MEIKRLGVANKKVNRKELLDSQNRDGDIKEHSMNNAELGDVFHCKMRLDAGLAAYWTGKNA